MYHIDMKMRKNSTHDVDKTFRNVALASSYTTVLRATVESAFGGNVSGEHTVKDARRDMFALAMLLLDAGCARPRSKEETRPGERMFEASDTVHIGLEELEAKVISFNANVVESPNRPAGVELDDEGDETGVSKQLAAEYVAATDDTFYDIELEELGLTSD